MQTEFYTEKPQQLKRKKRDKKAENNKRFHQCSIDEKINYLLNLPYGVPQMKCEITTKENTYRGKLIQEEEKSIWLEDRRRRKYSILKADIKEMYLISF